VAFEKPQVQSTTKAKYRFNAECVTSCHNFINKTVVGSLKLPNYFLNSIGTRTRVDRKATMKTIQLKNEKALSFSLNPSIILSVLFLLKNWIVSNRKGVAASM
jgi:hypothetical protein